MTTPLNRALRRVPLWTHFAILILVFLLCATASAVYVRHQTSADAARAARLHAGFAARTAARELGSDLHTARSSIDGLAANPGVAQVFQKPDGCTLASSPGSRIDLIRSDGVTVCSSTPPRGTRRYPEGGWFLQARTHSVLAAPVRDPATGGWAVAYAAPIQHAGVAAVVVALEPLAGALLRKYSGGEPLLFVLINRERVLARSEHADQYIGMPALPRPPSGDFTRRDRLGVTRFFSQAHVPGTDWTLIAGIDRNLALAPGRRLEREERGILLAGFLVMLAVVMVTYAALIQPIRAMGHAVRGGKRLPTHGPRELGSLAGDINAMLHRQERDRQAQKMEALGRLASGIAHDFNNLLLVISSGARSLMRASLDDKSTKAVERIDRAAFRGQQLTTQLLAFARQRVLAPVPTDVNVVVREMTVMLERVLGSDVQTRIELTPELPRVLIDEGQLAQVVLNLAINARDAMPTGGTLFIGTSAVTVVDEDHVPGVYVQVEVHDTGSGMDAETVERAFDPFFTTKDEGTGLGLSTVHGIVTGVGGIIEVTSTQGSGTTFTMRFPNAQMAEGLIPNEEAT